MRTNERVTGVVLRGDLILLFHRFRDGHEYWIFPGGGVEEGEDLETALRREMLEETSLGILGYTELFREEEDGVNYIYYRCEMEPGEPRLGGPELAEQSASNQHIPEWVPLRDLPSLPGLYPSATGLLPYLSRD